MKFSNIVTFALMAFAWFPTVGRSAGSPTASPSFADVVEGVQPRIVKVFGAGGLRRLESYQSGFLISPDGFVLTAWRYVLDTGEVTVILDDGRKFTANVVGADPRTEIAVLKIEANELPHFRLASSKRLTPGARVLAGSDFCINAVCQLDEHILTFQAHVS